MFFYDPPQLHRIPTMAFKEPTTIAATNTKEPYGRTDGPTLVCWFVFNCKRFPVSLSSVHIRDYYIYLYRVLFVLARTQPTLWILWWRQWKCRERERNEECIIAYNFSWKIQLRFQFNLINSISCQYNRAKVQIPTLRHTYTHTEETRDTHPPTHTHTICNLLHILLDICN